MTNPTNKKTDVVPVAPSLQPAQAQARISPPPVLMNQRIIFISFVAVLVAFAAGAIAQGLIRLIGLITNISFYGRVSDSFISPAGNGLGAWVIAVPAIGGLIVGLMARYGSAGIRGHGIPEAMEKILTDESRVSPVITFLKPISAAFSIGTGGPFGAEGPIIATGGALGSVVAQLMSTTADERKTLLAAGAAAGMAATFGSPVSAVLLAIELLLFEYRPRSFVPVALASATAAGVRMFFVGAAPAFAMSAFAAPDGVALSAYVFLGAVIGLFAAIATRAVYDVEDAFERLPIHWMWWPAIGGIAVGIIGYFFPKTMGVGYDNINMLLSGQMAMRALAFLCVMKFVSWAIALGSGTSGGTLAPLFTIGGALGGALGIAGHHIFPDLGIDPRIAALVGMSAIFAGSSRALLTSVVFAFETTGQPAGLLPLLGGCSAAYLVSGLFMRTTIMTEKIVRRGIEVPMDYDADYLALTRVSAAFTENPITFPGAATLRDIRQTIAGSPEKRHHAYPVLDAQGLLMGIVTERELMNGSLPADQRLEQLIRKPPAVVYPQSSLRYAADLMIQQGVGRLAVVNPEAPRHIIGILTRSDILSVHKKRLRDAHHAERSLHLRRRKAK